LRPPNVLSINRELELFNKYSRLSRLNPTTRIEEWTQLFKMQHQFIPTRLLDWSQSLNVALYFALKEDEHNPPCIILFSPILLYIKKVKQENEPINERNVSPKYINDLDFSYEDSIEGKKSSKYPVVIKPPHITDRIVAQKGCFTLHSKDFNAPDVLFPDCFEKIVIEGAVARKEIRTNILLYITPHDIFPDNFGLNQHLLQHFNLDGRIDKIIAEEIRCRWKSDLKRISKNSATDNLLFTGIKGAELANDIYIERTPDLKGELSKWNDINLTIQERACFIIAPAGAGKTNYILNYINQLYGYSEKQNNEETTLQVPVVIWCALGQLSPDETFIEAVVRSLGKLAVNLEINITTDMVRLLFKKQSSCLIIDGLDELARTQGTAPANQVIKDAFQELINSPKLRIIFGCRDHIFYNYVKKWLEKIYEDDPYVVNINLLDTSKIHEKIKNVYPNIESNSQVCKIAAEVPLFLSGVRNLNLEKNALKGVKTDSDFREVLLEATFKDKDKEEQYQQLGDVAVFMLNKRRDFLEKETLKKEESIWRTVKKFSEIQKSNNKSSGSNLKGWAIFIKEANQWRFVHQSIREYVLARNLSIGFSNLSLPNNIIANTSSLDYESAEVYCFLKEINTNTKKLNNAFRSIINDYATNFKGSQKEWNNVMRNYFEALGMLGELPDDILKIAVDFAITLLNEPNKSKNHPYCTFMTRYNAVRFLERIHPSSPKSYCKFRMEKQDIGELSEGSYSYIAAYAVRGFQKRQREIFSSNHEIIKKPDQYVYAKFYNKQDKKKQTLKDKVIYTLKDKFKNFGTMGEIDGGISELATNISQALIRWLPHDSDNRIWLKKHLKNTVFPKAIRSNLCLALWYRGENDYAKQKNDIMQADEKYLKNE